MLIEIAIEIGIEISIEIELIGETFDNDPDFDFDFDLDWARRCCYKPRTGVDGDQVLIAGHGVRASVQTSTRRQPACCSARASSLTVLPVVTTSSRMARWRPSSTPLA